MFNHYLRVLADVPRWTTLPAANRPQSVAEHSFFVSVYTMELLETYALYWSLEEKYATLKYAIAHDAAEARMGDILGPVKRRIKDPELYDAHEQRVMEQLDMDQYGCSRAGQKLVKAANLIDEYFYLQYQHVLGNKFVDRILPRAKDRLVAALEAMENIETSIDIVHSIVYGIETECAKLEWFDLEAENSDLPNHPENNGYNPKDEIPF